jgi:hypothetical protein
VETNTSLLREPVSEVERPSETDPELDSSVANVVEPPDVTVSEPIVTDEVASSIPEDSEVEVRVASETSTETVEEGMLASADEETDALELTGLHGPA